MKWILVGNCHINTNQLQLFRWDSGQLILYFEGCEDPEHWRDSDKKKYHQLCQALGVRPYEEVTA